MRALVFALLGLAAACSDEFAPCSANGQCLPGFACQEKRCVPCEGAACGSAAARGVGPRGAVVCGADDVCLRVPAGALDRYLDLRITRTSTPAPAAGLGFLAGVYTVEPTGEAFLAPAVLEIPISTNVDPAKISVYRTEAAGGAWTPVAGSTATPITATANIDRTALFTAAYPSGM